MITRDHHTSLFVTELDRSIAFYCDVLGFELLNDVNRPDHGIARIGFEVEEIEATVTALRAQGVELMSEVATRPLDVKHYAGGKAVFFRDPDGIVLELQQPPRQGQIT